MLALPLVPRLRLLVLRALLRARQVPLLALRESRVISLLQLNYRWLIVMQKLITGRRPQPQKLRPRPRPRRLLRPAQASSSTPLKELWSALDWSLLDLLWLCKIASLCGIRRAVVYVMVSVPF